MSKLRKKKAMTLLQLKLLMSRQRISTFKPFKPYKRKLILRVEKAWERYAFSQDFNELYKHLSPEIKKRAEKS